MGLFDLLNGIAGARSQDRIDAVEPVQSAIPGQGIELPKINDLGAPGGSEPLKSADIEIMSRPYSPTEQQPISQPDVNAADVNVGSAPISSIRPPVSESPLPESLSQATPSADPADRNSTEVPHFVGVPSLDSAAPLAPPAAPTEVTSSPIAPVPPLTPGIPIAPADLGQYASDLAGEAGQAPSSFIEEQPVVPTIAETPVPAVTTVPELPNLGTASSITKPPLGELAGNLDAIAQKAQEGLDQSPAVTTEIPTVNPLEPAMVDNLPEQAKTETELTPDGVSSEEEPVSMTREFFLTIAKKMFDEIQRQGSQSKNDNQGSISSPSDLPKAA